MNLGNLGKRVNLNTLKQYDFYKALLKEMENEALEDDERKYMQAFLESPEELGFNMLRPFYFFIKEKEDTTFYTMVMKMGNRAKYESGLMELFPDDYDENLIEKTGYQIWQNKTETYVWNDEVILNIWSEYTPSFDDLFSDENTEWDDYDWESDSIEVVFSDSLEFVDEYEFEENEIIEEDTVSYEEFEIDSSDFNEDGGYEYNIWGVDTRPAAVNWAEEIMTKRIGIPLSANGQYQTAKANNADLHFWMDYNYFLDEYKQTTSGFADMSDDKMAPFVDMATKFVYEIYGNSFLSWGLSFEQGKMAVRTEQFFNQKMKNFYAGIKKVKFNKKFFKHVEGGEDLFGYAYFNANIKNAIEEGRTVMHQILKSDPNYGLAASDAMKILGIFIDEEAIGNLFKGDLLLSFSGMQKIEVKETIYDYDEEFNFIEKDTLMETEVPNMTALATFGNRKDIQKFIDLGIHTDVLKRDGDFYKIEEPNSGFSFYLAIEKKMLIFSNNREKLVSSLENGFKKDRRLNKNHRKFLCKNASAFYWDVPNTMRQTAKNDGSTNFGPAYYLDVFGKQFESLTWKSSKNVNDSIYGQFDVNFKNKNTNSLEQFFIFINDIFVEFEGGAKI